MTNNKLKSIFPKYERPAVLYHASIHDVGPSIEPRRNWTCTRQETGHFVFAGESLDAAYAYALKTNGCLMSGNMNYRENAAGCYILFDNKEKLYALNPKGFIYALDSIHFEPVPNIDGLSYTGEWIARKPVPVASENIIPVTGIEESMKKGVQFFFLNRSPTDNEIKMIGEDGSVEKFAHLIKTKLLSWENHDRGINPSSPLLKELITSNRRMDSLPRNKDLA